MYLGTKLKGLWGNVWPREKRCIQEVAGHLYTNEALKDDRMHTLASVRPNDNW
jgi:hypothetical protein